ncbi:hypothetical protein [Pseudomonas sp. PWP3-1b2]|uniref:hypothetical protein n=1 Tax=Pseudomonas sp. PWP3-1b2 TaxID=2804656 RepID=UPI003CF334C9
MTISLTSLPHPFVTAPPTPAVHTRTTRAVDASPTPENIRLGTPSGEQDKKISPGKKPTLAPTPNHELDFAKAVIYGSVNVSPPTQSYTQQDRLQHVDAFAARVVVQIKHIESGEEGESNIRFQKTRQFLEPAGYFSGGLLAAGYDPHEKITVTFNAYVGKWKPEHKTNTDERTYFAWEIAAGALKHDRPAGGGLLNFQTMEIQPKDRNKINGLEALGARLQDHWTDDITKPMQDASGALAKRSGKADAYAVRGTLQSLRNDKHSYEKLTPAGQEAINRTLDKNGNVVIPNVYGYPLAGYAFVPYVNYHGDYDHRPNKGLMIDLKNGKINEIHGDKDFANWAKQNRSELQRSFNSKDRQGGKDAHWPKAVDVLDNLIAGNHATYPGRQSLFKDKAVPVRETFNYSQSRKDDYFLKFGKLNDGIAADYQALNARNAQSDDQTEVFGSAQQSWKGAKELWGRTFGYIPVVGNTGNIVFGIHDSLHGKTADDRVGGTAAAVISGLQLAHEIAPSALEAGLGEPSLPAQSATNPHYRWKYDEQSSDFEFVRTPKASTNAETGAVKTATTPTSPFAGMQEIKYRGKTYFVADKPDAWDGTAYLLRVKDPKDSSKLASSAIIARPDETGVWNKAGETGGGRWFWNRPITSTASDESLSTPKFSERFVESDGSKIPGSGKFDDYLSVDESKDYTFINNLFSDGPNVKRRLAVSWRIDDGQFAVTETERAQPIDGYNSEYSTSFPVDLNRGDYTIVTREGANEVRTRLDFRSTSDEETIKTRLATLEATIPDPNLRARISEVAHQGASFPAFVELMPPVLKEGYSVSAGEKYFTIEYNPGSDTHTVKATTKWDLKLLTEDGGVTNRDLDITSTRIFTIRASNDVSGDGYVIDKSAPTRIEISTPAAV